MEMLSSQKLSSYLIIQSPSLPQEVLAQIDSIIFTFLMEEKVFQPKVSGNVWSSTFFLKQSEKL